MHRRKISALKRFMRKGDFRASGSGIFSHDREVFDEWCIRLALDMTRKLGAHCLAYDFIFDEANTPLLVEISYGFSPHGYQDCPGFWDEELQVFERVGKFNQDITEGAKVKMYFKDGKLSWAKKCLPVNLKTRKPKR